MNISTDLLNRAKVLGFTLIELMISIVIGLIILAAVSSMLVSTIGSNSDNLKAIRLNQELRATMNLMVRDIRRAGADALAVSRGSGTYPFSSSTTRITVSNNQQGIANACVTFAFDADEDGNDDGNTERFGYRLDSTEGAVEMRQAGAACSASGWENVTDENITNITNLEFLETCVVESGLRTRQIQITLTGRLRLDTTVTRALVESVRVRNGDVGTIC